MRRVQTIIKKSSECRAMMCNSDSGIGIEFQEFPGMVELELNQRLKLQEGIEIGIEMEAKITRRLLRVESELEWNRINIFWVGIGIEHHRPGKWKWIRINF